MDLKRAFTRIGCDLGRVRFGRGRVFEEGVYLNSGLTALFRHSVQNNSFINSNS